MKQRLQKILSERGIASRRAAEKLIEQGRVSCNGMICQVGDSADPDLDEICLDGKPLPSKPAYCYIMLHKPTGYVTTLSDEKGRPDVSRLVADCGQRVYPVGRLDMDSEGLLILTNDGEFANYLMHPRHVVEKTYLVRVSGYSELGFEKLAQPVELDGYRIRAPKLSLIKQAGDKAVLQIVIHEGRNRQIRRMCDMAGMRVERLRRVQEGSLVLGDLPAGKWRYLTDQEVEHLKSGL